MTTILKLSAKPVQPLAEGIIRIKDEMGIYDPLVAVNSGIKFESLATNPILVLLFVQINIVPLTEPVNDIEDDKLPPHMV